MKPSPFTAGLFASIAVLMSLVTGLSPPHFLPAWAEIPIFLTSGFYIAAVVWTNRRAA